MRVTREIKSRLSSIKGPGAGEQNLLRDHYYQHLVVIICRFVIIRAETACTLLAREEIAAILLGTAVAASSGDGLAVLLAGNITEGVD